MAPLSHAYPYLSSNSEELYAIFMVACLGLNVMRY